MKAWWKESSSTLCTNKGGLSDFCFPDKALAQGARRKANPVLVFTFRLCAFVRKLPLIGTIPNYLIHHSVTRCGVFSHIRTRTCSRFGYQSQNRRRSLLCEGMPIALNSHLTRSSRCSRDLLDQESKATRQRSSFRRDVMNVRF